MSAPVAPIESFIERLPKAELHLHLEGAIRPPVLLRLARRRGVSLPADDVAGLERWFAFRDFEHFVEIYLTISRCLRDPEDFQLVAEDVLSEQARQRVVYTEAHFTISTHVANGVNGEEVADALAETLHEAPRRFGVELRLIPDIVRNQPRERADVTLEWALAGRSRGVVALGLAGIERYPAAPFAEHFNAARDAGLACVAHAGEQEGPESIRETLESCAPRRLGHGIRAVDDPALVAELAAGDVPLEICPTSNVRLGLAPSIAEHPVAALQRAGVALTLNSDDPPLFGTTLNDEYRRVAAAFDLSPQELAALSLAGLRDALLPEERRRELDGEFRESFAALGEELFGAPVEPASAARQWDRVEPERGA